MIARLLGLALILGMADFAAASEAAEHHAGPDWKMLGLAALNLAILIGVLVRYAGKPVNDFLFQRSEGIRSALQDAQAQLAAAQAENAKLQDRLAHLADEARDIIDQARRQALGERERMQQRARETAGRIREEAQRVADMEIARARHALREEAATLATSLAAEMLRERIRPEDDQRMLAEFVAGVGRTAH